MKSPVGRRDGRRSPVRVPVLVPVLALFVVTLHGGPARADEDGPAVVKDSLVLTANIHSEGTQEGWKPGIAFRVNGPLASGDQLWVDFKGPGGKTLAKFDCETGETKKGAWWETTATPSNDVVTTHTGLVDFAIHLRNELQGTEKVLYTGKAKVTKWTHPKNKEMVEYYVDEDWRLPIGYVYLGPSIGHGVTFLHVGFWYRGNPPDVSAHLFHQGKEVAKYTSAGNGAGDWDPSRRQWGFVGCNFLGVYGTAKEAADGYDPKWGLDAHPGEYEVKVLIVNRLARSIKFTIDKDGKPDFAISKANRLGNDRAIVPVKVIGDQGPWDKAAWKTGAYYGNPLTGFAAAE